ncbi:hypothetical protein niasHS_014599 [Heterodera schachtii]|uniref:KxDL domain-containing protein n=1 Tax=Heterodera schachtii TaxID=97005 RepID=A0ABD2IF27_HETSC
MSKEAASSTVLPPSSSQSISMASSADGSPLREENFVHSLKSQVDGENIEEIIQSQKKALERFEKTNEMLGTCSSLAEKRLDRARKDFAIGKEKICRAKSDLDSIFRRIASFKQTLANNYPAEFVAAQTDSPQNSDCVNEHKKQTDD